MWNSTIQGGIHMKKATGYLTILALSMALAACTTDDTPTPENETPPTEEEQNNQDETNDENTGEEETDDNREDEQPTVEFDPQIEDTIEIEGREEPITLNLYEPEGAPFITYAPEDLLAEEGSEEGSHFFYANFGDEKVEDVYLQLYLFPDDVTEQPSAEEGEYAELVEGMELQEEFTYYDWSLEEYQSPDGSNLAALGEHEGQFYLVVIHSTVEYSEGFYPRANKVIEHLEWLDGQAR